MPIPLDLKFDAGKPPNQWMDSTYSPSIIATVLCFWETTVALFHNETILSQHTGRFPAMVHDHIVSVRWMPVNVGLRNIIAIPSACPRHS